MGGYRQKGQHDFVNCGLSKKECRKPKVGLFNAQSTGKKEKRADDVMGFNVLRCRADIIVRDKMRERSELQPNGL